MRRNLSLWQLPLFLLSLMNLLKCGMLLVSASLLSACSDDARNRIATLIAPKPKATITVEAAPEISTDSMSELLTQLTSLNAIGLNLAYVEKVAGPPMRSEEHQHQFKVQGCSLKLTTDEQDKAIRAVEIAVTTGCNVDVHELLDQQEPQSLSSLTFGTFDQAGVGQYLAECLTDCGNAYTPSIYLKLEGSRAMQFTEVMVSVPLDEGPVLQAKDQWVQAMVTKEGEDWVAQSSFNCDPQKYRDVAAQAMKTIRPSSISFGHGMQYPQCPSEESQDAGESTGNESMPASGQASMIVVPHPQGNCDMEYGRRLKAAGLQAQKIYIHGPEDQDFSGYACPYRITPKPGSVVPAGSRVTYRSAWEAG